MINAIENDDQQAFDRLQWVLPHLTKPKDPKATGLMPMHVAVVSDDRQPLAMALLHAGHRVDQRDDKGGDTPLEMAVQQQSWQAVNVLLNVLHRGKRQWSPILRIKGASFGLRGAKAGGVCCRTGLSAMACFTKRFQIDGQEKNQNAADKPPDLFGGNWRCIAC